MTLHAPEVREKLANRVDQLVHRADFASLSSAKTVGYLWGGWTPQVAEVNTGTYPFWVLRRGQEWAAVMWPTTEWRKQDLGARLRTVGLMASATSTSGTDLVAMCTALAEQGTWSPMTFSAKTLALFTLPREEFPEMADASVQTLLGLTGVTDLVTRTLQTVPLKARRPRSAADLLAHRQHR